METAQAFIIDAGWVFFLAWAVVLLLICAAAFGRNPLSRKRIPRSISTTREGGLHEALKRSDFLRIP
ncbi:MAG TPA: hypothetical protein VMU61_09990 [Candidatus Aquilonibacter sp.]|nr:hypothetical protein [Candidatus Aquilonibacter sp.]